MLTDHSKTCDIAYNLYCTFKFNVPCRFEALLRCELNRRDKINLFLYYKNEERFFRMVLLFSLCF